MGGRQAAVLVVVAALGWSAWVGDLIDRSPLGLLPVMAVVIVFGFGTGAWLGYEMAAVYTFAGLALLGVLGSLTALAGGSPGAGLPILLGSIPALIALLPAQAGGRWAERRRRPG